MREINVEDTRFHALLNKMYAEYRDEGHEDQIISFATHIRKKYGIKISIRPNREQGDGHYELTQVFVEDEARYNWLILEWT